MANGKCSKCLVILTPENSTPGVLRYGYGYCLACRSTHKKKAHKDNPEKTSEINKRHYKQNAEKLKKAASDYRKRNPEKVKEGRRVHYRNNRQYYLQRSSEFARQPAGRYGCLRRMLKKEVVHSSDLLWSFNFYSELIRDNECHYCLGQLNPAGHALDRVKNTDGHAAFNVVPCCRECNRIKGKYWEYEHMMLLAPKLRKLRQEIDVDSSLCSMSSIT